MFKSFSLPIEAAVVGVTGPVLRMVALEACLHLVAADCMAKILTLQCPVPS